MAKKPKKIKQKTERQQWEEKLLSRLAPHHKRKLPAVAKRLMKKIDSARYGMIRRSEKVGVGCTVTVNELRELVYTGYGSGCKYCGKPLILNCIVFDHIIPISKGGPSTKTNTQIICKTCNGVKGSLSEDQLTILLNWMKTLSDDMQKDIRTRLARGVR